MFPLRYRICRDLLGLHPVKDPKTGKVTGWKRERSQKEVEVVFPELESGSYLSCSNTIALGATYFGAYLLQKAIPSGWNLPIFPNCGCVCPKRPIIRCFRNNSCRTGAAWKENLCRVSLILKREKDPNFRSSGKRAAKKSCIREEGTITERCRRDHCGETVCGVASCRL